MRRCRLYLATGLLSAALTFVGHSADANSIVTFDTVLGSFQVELFADVAPITVANFLSYVNDGDYNGTFIHRSVPNFVIQGGGYVYNNGSAPHIPTDPPIVNEFSLSNVRGTIAMAKGSDPNSATSEWFINLVNNPHLDNPANSGGFTVFGGVLGNGMQVVDGIAALPLVNAGGAFSSLPVLDSNPQFPDDLVFVSSITVPEPAAMIYVMAAIAGIALRSCRRHRA